MFLLEHVSPLAEVLLAVLRGDQAMVGQVGGAPMHQVNPTNFDKWTTCSPVAEYDEMIKPTFQNEACLTS